MDVHMDNEHLELRTRHHAVWLGILVFSLTTLSIYLLGLLLFLSGAEQLLDPWADAPYWEATGWRRLARSFVSCLPVALLIGIPAGLDAQRYAVRACTPVGPFLLLAFSVPFLSADSGTFEGVLFGVVVFGVFQWLHRVALLGHSRLRFTFFLIVYLVLISSFALNSVGYRYELADALAASSAAGLLFSDAFVVGWVNLWKLDERLDTTQGNRVRFSLRALLLLFAAWALHLTLLSRMFADKLR